MSHDRTDSSRETSFAERAMTLAGKTAEEARRTGAIDRADDEVEKLFSLRHQTQHSPLHQAVWNREFPAGLFFPPALPPSDAALEGVLARSLQTVERRRAAGSLYGGDGKLSEELLGELAACGYWGLLVEREYGGANCPLARFFPFLTQMAAIDATTAGMASVHGCIGAVDPLRTFGTSEQKSRLLPPLARGERLSAFALTEPGAGSDLTALAARAQRRGDQFLVTGEKLFITNVAPGRTLGLVCLVEGAPAVLICELPAEENEQFRLVRYGLHALVHTHNRGIVFREFPVPAANLLAPPQGNGLTIAYHGLNLGRTALCANAAGVMRVLLASMIPWAAARVTYGEPIARRELVRRRLARLAGLIVGCDALTSWCGGLLDAGFRGEMECIVAKVFASESLKEAAIELCLKTHGGRSFLHGHLVGDHLHEYLAPCIYEGEGEMLGMALFKSLVKQHGQTFFEPLGRSAQAAGLARPNPLNPLHFWKLRRPLLAYAGWLCGRRVVGPRRARFAKVSGPLQRAAEFAAGGLQRMGDELSRALRKHQLKLADRQGRIWELADRVQKLTVMLVTALYGARSEDESIRLAAQMLCRDLQRQLTGQRVSDADFRAANGLGELVAGGRFSPLAGVPQAEILRKS